MNNTVLRIKTVENKQFVFDIIRKKWVRLTPEESVRQFFLNFMITHKKYPAASINVEKQLGEHNRRYDMVVYKNQKPWLIVECKSEKTVIRTAAIHQILNYLISLEVQFLVITNQLNTYIWAVDREHIAFIPLTKMPDY